MIDTEYVDDINECQFCEFVYFDNMKEWKEHLECYHKKEFDMITKSFWN